jgi:hypothetical protein
VSRDTEGRRRYSPACGLDWVASCVGLAATLVRSNTVQNGGRVAVDDAGDLRPAIAAVRVMTDEPPQLVSCSRDGLSSATPAKLVRGDPALNADGINQLAQAANGEGGKDSVGMRGRVHGVARGEAGRKRGWSDISRLVPAAGGRRCEWCGTDGADG